VINKAARGFTIIQIRIMNCGNKLRESISQNWGSQWIWEASRRARFLIPKAAKWTGFFRPLRPNLKNSFTA